MGQMDELLSGLTEELESRQIQKNGIAANVPNVPLMILYMGSQASRARKDITDTLRQVWRRRADSVAQLMVEDGIFYSFSEESPKEISVEEFQEAADKLYAQEDSFHNMNDFLLVMVFDTTDYECVEAFVKSYESVEKICQYTGQTYCLTMSITFLDESASGRKMSREIQQYLREQMNQKQMLYRSAVLLSNRMYNGILLAGERKRENYDLAGTIILLADSCGANYKTPVALLFPTESDPYYLTAAYSRVGRPNRKICEILVNGVMKWIGVCLNEGEGLPLDELCGRLEVSGGTAGVISDFYKREIGPVLPGKEALEYMPRASKSTESLCSRPYVVLQQETLGCADAFYQQEFIPKIENAAVSFRKEFQSYLSRRIKAGEALKITDAVIDQAAEQIRKSYPLDNTPAYQYMLERAEADFISLVLPQFREEMRRLKISARDYIRQLQEIEHEFQEGYFVDPDEESIRDYYDKTAENYLNGQNAERLRGKLMNMEGTSESLICFIKETVIEILSSDSIFEASLMDEITARMGADSAVIQETLRNELLNELGDKIRLKTLTVPTMLQEMFIVSQKDSDGQATRFFTYLQELRKNQANVEFFDSGNNNSMGVLRLYRCDANLII